MACASQARCRSGRTARCGYAVNTQLPEKYRTSEHKTSGRGSGERVSKSRSRAPPQRGGRTPTARRATELTVAPASASSGLSRSPSTLTPCALLCSQRSWHAYAPRCGGPVPGRAMALPLAPAALRCLHRLSRTADRPSAGISPPVSSTDTYPPWSMRLRRSGKAPRRFSKFHCPT